MFNTIPAGTWRIVNGSLVPATFDNAHIFSSGYSYCQAHEPYEAIGSNNNADFISPDGENHLGTRVVAMALREATMMNNFYTQSSLLNSTGVVSSDGTMNGRVSTSSVNSTQTHTGLRNVQTSVAPFQLTVSNRIGFGNSSFAPVYGGVKSDLTAPDTKNTQTVFNSRLAFIEKYCDKYGAIIDVEKIRSKFANNTEAGVKFCDNVINNKLNQARVKQIVKKQYDEYTQSRLDAGKQVSNQWVDAVLKAGLKTPEIAQSTNQDNVLDVIGTFMTNDEVKNGKVSFENVFEQPQVSLNVVESLIAKANEICKRPETSKATKELLLKQISTLRDTCDEYENSISDNTKENNAKFSKIRNYLTHDITSLFATARREQALQNDKAAKTIYGLPESSQIKLTSQTERANTERASYQNRRKLSTKF